MVMDAPSRIASNAGFLERELEWVSRVMETRINLHYGQESRWVAIEAVPMPEVQDDPSIYAGFVRHYELGLAERLAVILALLPYLRPQLLDLFLQPNERLNRGYTEFGGILGKAHGGFLPTGETLLFLAAGDDLLARFNVQQVFDRDHFFNRHNILKLETVPHGEPLLAGQLVLADETVDYLTSGELRKPDFSRDFPARLIHTDMEWDDLVLPANSLVQLRELEAWVRHESVLMNEWGLGRRLRPGYKCLFYGPPGTGKTLTASLLGKRVERDVYRISLASVVSKYIGETEKNLERIFDRAENMRCILFFDEADSLFAKRTNISDAHDRYANQEVSYLLQRLEEYPGVVILATNYRGNIDDAFTRRFQAVVHFPMPGPAERQRLWSGAFSSHSKLEEALALQQVADSYEVSGGAIMNAVRYASLMALEAGDGVIRSRDLIEGIRRELQKEGKTL